MRTIGEILRSIIGLFFGDGFLAIAILAVVLVTALLVLELGARPAIAVGFLISANLAVLTASVFLAARRGKPL